MSQRCQLHNIEYDMYCMHCAKANDPKAARIAFLERKRAITIEDGKLKLEGEDWHGVADAAMDLRDIDNELDGLRF